MEGRKEEHEKRLKLRGCKRTVTEGEALLPHYLQCARKTM
jgi:hypothetical protein